MPLQLPVQSLFWDLGFKDHPNIALILDFMTLFVIIVISLITSLLKQIDIFEVPAELLISRCASPETWPSFYNKVKWKMATSRYHHIFLCIRKKKSYAIVHWSYHFKYTVQLRSPQFKANASLLRMLSVPSSLEASASSITIITEQVGETNSSIEVSFASAVVQLEWSRHSFPTFPSSTYFFVLFALKPYSK